MLVLADSLVEVVADSDPENPPKESDEAPTAAAFRRGKGRRQQRSSPWGSSSPHAMAKGEGRQAKHDRVQGGETFLDANMESGHPPTSVTCGEDLKVEMSDDY